MAAYEAFRSRDYRFLLAGNILSVLGMQMLSIVVGWDLYQATRSPVALGNVGLVQIVPVLLFTFAAGHVADRYDRRTTLLVAQSIVAAMGFVLAFSGSSRSVTLIYSCLFLSSLARTFQFPAASSILPKIVPLEHLSNALSWNGMGRELSTFIGPAIAGLLIASFGSSVVYLAQAGCSILTMVCFFSLVPKGAPAGASDQGGIKAVGEGVRFVFREKLVLNAMTLDLIAVFFGGATALLPIFAEDILHIGPRGLGWLRAAPAVGAGSMALWLAHQPPIRRAGVTLLAVVAGFGLATIGFALSRNEWLSFALLVAVGALDSVSVVMRSYLVHSRTPDSLRGRVNAVNALFISSSNQWGAVESGLAAKWMGTVPSVVFGGATTVFVVALIATFSGSLRRWRNS